MTLEMKRKGLIAFGVVLGTAFAVRFWLPGRNDPFHILGCSRQCG